MSKENGKVIIVVATTIRIMIRATSVKIYLHPA